ncbi:GntR family transcriptional regulator [Lactovum odontotermitis]
MKTKPKYLQIYDDIKSKILCNAYPINSKLPDGRQLTQEYSASIMTVKKALDILVEEGYIIRRRGDGTHVKDWTKGRKAHLYAPEGSTQVRHGNVTSKVITFEVIHPYAQVAEKLSIDTDDFVYRIERLRFFENVPAIMEYTFMPISVIPGLKYEHLVNSVYSYIQGELGLTVHSSFLNITGVRPNQLEQEQMQLSDTDFLIQVEQVADLDDGRLFEYSIARHRPEKFQFETIIFNN